MYADLHIHSCLSPCAENEMSPANIAGMAYLKGQQAIAVTDHNAAFNLPYVKKACDEYGVALLPGMELCTREEVHLLAYFRSVDDALIAGEYFYSALPDVENDKSLFGEQLVMDETDEIIAEKDKLLLSALPLSFLECCNKISEFGGIFVPAHINRGGNGLLNCLGLFPETPKLPVVEVSPHLKINQKLLAGRTVLNSSDAHRLCDMAEKGFELPVDGVSGRRVFDFLRALF
ncbi:MAG: PHP domain-containing protein [Eubacteriales bacterium]|nr:PHP domain-containing protein [Eubacteriales bacterium]MDD3882124.1 PHP domain-containing protein [Eubacteriales bacterium]MDD4513229.1 PHP domain-containing protein [Eubacteriales bacterium]